VSGPIVAARTLANRCFLNFHEDYRQHVSVMIPREAFDKFAAPPEQLFSNKHVRVSGVITDFQGRLQIVVESPDQIEVIPAPATQPSPAPASQPAPSPDAPASKPAGVARPFTGRVKIATYNVLNLFDAVDDPYHDDEGTPTKPTNERERVAATIRALDADVLALQEVENRGVLEAFVAELLPDLGYGHIVLFEGNDTRGIDVAVLSRLPVGPVTSYRHLKFPRADGTIASFERDLLRVRIEPPDALTFDIFVVHLKSKRGRDGSDDPTLPIRQAEALAVRQVLDDVLSEDPAARFLICGDFNDRIDSLPMRTLLGEGERALRTWATELPAEQCVSYNKEPFRSMIDFILCSPALAARFEPGSYAIVAGSVESSGSDHNPVAAMFDLRPNQDSESLSD